MADKSNFDELVITSKSLQSGGSVPFPSYGGGYGAIQGFESEIAWSSYIDSELGYGGVNNTLKYRRLLGDPIRNSLMCAAIRFLGDSFLEAPVQVKEKEGGLSGKKGESKIVADHKLPALMNTPNEFYDGNQLKKGIALSLVLSGNAYILKNFNEVGLWPLELWWEPHWTIRPMFPIDGSSFLSHYEVNRNGMWYPIDLKNVIHIRDGLHPYNQRIGFTGNDAISPELFADASAADYYANLLGGSGTPQFLIGIDKDMKMDPKKVESLQKYIVAKTSGAQKGQPLVIGGARAYKLGISPKDLDIREARMAAEDRFCATQGIPAVVLELGSGSSHPIYNNVKQAEERAWKSYICPKLTLIEGCLNHSLLNDFEDEGSGRYVEYDLSQIQALQEDQDLKAKRLGELFKNGGITRKELRSGMGYGDSVDGDEEVDNVFFVNKGGVLVKPTEQPLASGEQIIDMATGDIRAGAPPPQPGFGDPNATQQFGNPSTADGTEAQDTSLLSLVKSSIKGGPGPHPHGINKDEFIAREIADAPAHWEARKKTANAHEAYRKLIQKLDKTKKSLEFSQAIQDLLPDGYLNPKAGWTAFSSEMNSLNIPRTSMPQVMSNHRGALVQFLRGRGIAHSKEDVLPNTLSPSQAEYRPDKVESAKEWEGTQRPILVSSDNRVVDGHHQWMAAMDTPDEPIPVIKLDSPILPLLLEVARFPSSGVKDENDDLQFWNKAMPSKGLVTGKDITETISFLKKHRYNEAADLMQAGKMTLPKAIKKSNGNSILVT